jgi:3-phosphoshikimate 1-carboxyvinyltransferase
MYVSDMNLKEITKIEIQKLDKKVDKILSIPSSKSLSVRALILAAFSKGQSIVKNVLDSDDTNNCINCIKEMGIKVEQNCRDFTMHGNCGTINNDKDLILFAGSSGITARFLVAMLSVAQFNHSIVIDGTAQLKKRPIKPLVDALLKIGCSLQYLENDGFLPLKILPNKTFKNNDILQVSGKDSSQYVSAMLMLAPLIGLKVQPTDIDNDNHPYIQMALQTMKFFGINYTENNDIYSFEKQTYKSTDFTIETDCNTANYFFSLAVISNSKIEINNISKDTLQPGVLFLPILEKLGAKVTYKNTSILVEGNEQIKGGFELDMFKTAEMAITLSVLAIFADAPIKIYGIAHIRKHETDRINAIATELAKLGIKTEEFDDGIKIYPSQPNNKIEIDTYEDHRIAMSFALLGVKNGVTLLDPKCVSKTCPEFFNLLESIDIKMNY